MTEKEDFENDVIYDEENYKVSLSLQLSEIEMLRSIFSNPGELVVDESVIEAVNNYVNNETNCIPASVSFTINLQVDNLKLEVLFSLPRDYPNVKPNFYITSGVSTRQQYSQMMKDLNEYITKVIGESCIYSIIVWLQENIANYSVSNKTNTSSDHDHLLNTRNKSFSRYWIYSHHIYNKMKRKQILELAETFNVTGFCLPGKPGIICIEGSEENCNDWWQIIKSLTWQKIKCIKTEQIKIDPDVSYKELQKFADFNELNFSTSKVHMDMGRFYSYLEEHNCGYIFKDYFGLDGKRST